MKNKLHIFYLLILILIFSAVDFQTKNIVNEYDKKITQKNNVIADKELKIDSLTSKANKADSLYTLLEKLKVMGNVDVTMYQPKSEQTNERYWETADQSIINLEDPSKHRWLAVSRDLHVRYGGELNFGDVVMVTGVGKYTGFYEVRDLMNARFTKRIDILMGNDDPQFKFESEDVTMYKVPDKMSRFAHTLKNTYLF